jgi:hypothetical protein
MIDLTPYKALIGLMAAVALLATTFGFGGLFVVLTGGTMDGDPGVDILGGYDCETFDGDPEVAHEAGYEIEVTLVDGTEVGSFNGTAVDGGTRVTIEMEGELLNASARGPDGTDIPLRQDQDRDRVVIERVGPEPFRLWIDSVSADATVTRTKLDVCPPSSASSA